MSAKEPTISTQAVMSRLTLLQKRLEANDIALKSCERLLRQQNSKIVPVRWWSRIGWSIATGALAAGGAVGALHLMALLGL